MVNYAIDPRRPKISNSDGSFSTERTIGVEMDGRYFNIPTIVGGRQLSDDAAIAAFREGRNPAVGEFASQYDADLSAPQRSAAIGRLRGGEGQGAGMNGLSQYSTKELEAMLGGAPSTIATSPRMGGGVVGYAPGGEFMGEYESADEAQRAGLLYDAGQRSLASRSANAQGQEQPQRPRQLSELSENELVEMLAYDSGRRHGGNALDSFVGQGLMMGYGDEIKGAVRGGVRAAKNWAKGGDFNYDRMYAEEVGKARGNYQAFEERNPAGSTGLEIGGAVTGAVLPGGAVAKGVGAGAKAVGGVFNALTAVPKLAPKVISAAKTIPGKIVAGALGGGTQAGIYASGKEDGGTLVERFSAGLEAVPEGMVIGGAVGGAAGALERRAMRKGREAQEAFGRQAQADEFEIPLTRGQSTRNYGDLGFEQAVRSNAMGDSAGATLRGFDDAQGAAMRDAEGRIGAAFSPYQRTMDENLDALQTGIKRKEAQAKSGVDAAYKQFRDLGGMVDRNAVEMIPAMARKGLEDANVFLDEVTTPQAMAAWRDLHDLAGMKIGTKLSDAADGERINVSIDLLDKTRQRLWARYKNVNPASPTAKSDRRAVVKIIEGYDDLLEEVVETALLAGDEKTLDALQRARGLHKEYMRLFSSRRRGGDAAGRMIERITGHADDDPVTAQHLANAMWGQVKIGNTKSSVAMAMRAKSIMGAKSPEWAGTRQGLWSAIVEPPGKTLTAAQKATRINDFLDGSGRSLAGMVFTPAERATMKRLAEVYGNTVVPKGVRNDSGSGYRVIEKARPLIASLVGSLAGAGSFAAGGGGMGAGMAAMSAAGATNTTINILNKFKTNRATKRVTGQGGRAAKAGERASYGAQAATLPFTGSGSDRQRLPAY